MPVDDIRPDQEGTVLLQNPAGQIARADGAIPTLTFPALFNETAQSGITAFAGGGQASATPLTAQTNRVTTSAATTAPFDSVKLPASAAGLEVTVANTSANPIQVFGAGPDQINGLPASVGITMPPNSVDIFVCTAVGSWFAEVGVGFSGSLPTTLSQDGVTAFAGGGQASATPLIAEITRVTTVATAGDSVKLPPAAAGLDVYVINHGANSLQVFGSGTDTIDDVAAATGVSQMVGSLVLYSCTGSGRWYANGIGTGFAGAFPTVSFVNGLTARAGGGQASATPLTAAINRVTTVATANDSVLLPASSGGMQITVSNAAAVNSLNIFPAGADQINALGASAAFAVPAGKTASFTCAVPGQWHAILSA